MSKVILFQGDSITDSGRSREYDCYGGYGYPTLIKAELGYEKPGEYVFYNRGVSGNRVLDLYSRIVCDILNIKPDYMSILIGVNDVWHGFSGNGTGLKRYEKVYNDLIADIKEELPDIKIIILGPFVLKGTGTVSEEDPQRWDIFKNGVTDMAEAAKRVAEKFSLPFVDLQEKFDEACKKAPADYWTVDGVHPTAMGHEIIKRVWLDTFDKIK